MTKEEIIKEGWLEAYFTGEVKEEEAQIIEAFLQEDKDVQKEYERLQITLTELAFLQQKKPSDSVKENVLASIQDKKVIRLKRQSNFLFYATAASVLLAVVLSYTTYSFRNNWLEAERRNQSLLLENQSMTLNMQEANNTLEMATQKVSIVSSADYQKILLNGTDNAPNKQAVVFWSPLEQKVYLSSGNLKSLSASQQYQLWALIDGKPIDAGVFNPKDGLFVMKDIQQADAFAITIEKQGGSEQPDLSTLQVIGNAS